MVLQNELQNHLFESPDKGDGHWLATALSRAGLRLLAVVAALMLSTPVYAVGLGGINVTSALGQPLKADIELIALSNTERDSLVAHLASPDDYKSAGLDYPYGNNFKFEILNHADGQPYIKASSKEPVNDPFVSLLVELTWSAGKLSREYTFLLDPPGYVANQPAAAKVQAVVPQVQPAVSELASSGVAPTPEAAATVAAPINAVTPAESTATAESVVSQEMQAQAASGVAAVKPAAQAAQTAQPDAAAAAAAAASEAAALPGNKEWLEVRRGDTLYKLADKYKMSGMNLDRMLVALYRVNASKFDGRNMNRIRAGKILRLPTQAEYDNVSQSAAERDIHAQAADWHAYRQKLASAASESTQPQEAQQVATGKISSSIADMAPVAKETAREVLKLSKGAAPGDKVGAGGIKGMSAQDQKNAADEDAIAKKLALKEEQQRAAMLEKNLKDMQRLAQLKAQVNAMANPAPAPAEPAAAPVPAPAQVPVASTLPTPAAPKPPVAKPAAPPARVAKPLPTPVKPEPSLIDQLLDEPLYLAAAAGVLVLGGLGFVVYRRKKNSSETFIDEPASDVGDITGRLAAPVMPSPDTGDFTVSSSPGHAAGAADADNIDPINEADLFLNFGRDAQAEEILKDALQSNPNNHQIHLKLLGIYANRKDATAFSEIAGMLQHAGDNDAWQQAVAMGRKLDPGNPMYGGGGPVSMEDTGSATVQTPAFNPAAPKPPSALDFDFDAGGASADTAPSPEQDFLTEAGQTAVLSANGGLGVPEMDFDITSGNTSGQDNQDSGMDFDITSSSPAVAEEAVAVPVVDDLMFEVPDSDTSTGSQDTQTDTMTSDKADDGGLAFTLDFPQDDAPAKASPVDAPAAASSLEGINLNFDDAAEPAETAAAGGDDQWQDVATKLDLAKAYQEMGDLSGAREILDEVLREGDTGQRESAQAIIEQLG